MIACSNDLAFPWEVDLGLRDTQHLAEVDNWCRDRFGDQGKLWIASNNGWCLRNREDAIMLEITWGLLNPRDS